jgi:hypothetical protein
MEQTNDKPRVFKIIIDNKPFEWRPPAITGNQVKELVKAKLEYGVWLVVPGPKDDEEIGNDQTVDLTEPGRERFITGPKKTTEGGDPPQHDPVGAGTYGRYRTGPAHGHHLSPSSGP